MHIEDYGLSVEVGKLKLPLEEDQIPFLIEEMQKPNVFSTVNILRSNKKVCYMIVSNDEVKLHIKREAFEGKSQKDFYRIVFFSNELEKEWVQR